MSGPGAALPPTAIACPFCGAPAEGARCPACGRDPTARRAVCAMCGQMTPVGEKKCCHCTVPQGGETLKKVVIIVALFIAALVRSILVHSVR